LLSFVPDLLLFTAGFSVIVVGAYILMHIATAIICVIGLTNFTQARDEAGHARQPVLALHTVSMQRKYQH
jgi:hypothetical protein